MKKPTVTPMPVPTQAPQAILYGGVFDPPHRAHIELALAARDAAARGAWLVFVPAARSPFKGSPGASDADRIEMLRLAASHLPRTAIWTDEIDRGQSGEPSYWIDTLRRARSALPAAALAFLIGADQAAEFHRWREFRAILETARPRVMLREPVGTPELLRERLAAAGAWSEEEIKGWLAAVVPLPLRDVSATRVREKLARGDAHIPELHEAVLGYIRQRGLYR